jgi:hypothetical protein
MKPQHGLIRESREPMMSRTVVRTHSCGVIGLRQIRRLAAGRCHNTTSGRIALLFTAHAGLISDNCRRLRDCPDEHDPEKRDLARNVAPGRWHRTQSSSPDTGTVRTRRAEDLVFLEIFGGLMFGASCHCPSPTPVGVDVRYFPNRNSLACSCSTLLKVAALAIVAVQPVQTWGRNERRPVSWPHWPALQRLRVFEARVPAIGSACERSLAFARAAASGSNCRRGRVQFPRVTCSTQMASRTFISQFETGLAENTELPSTTPCCEHRRGRSPAQHGPKGITRGHLTFKTTGHIEGRCREQMSRNSLSRRG